MLDWLHQLSRHRLTSTHTAAPSLQAVSALDSLHTASRVARRRLCLCPEYNEFVWLVREATSVLSASCTQLELHGL